MHRFLALARSGALIKCAFYMVLILYVINSGEFHTKNMRSQVCRTGHIAAYDLWKIMMISVNGVNPKNTKENGVQMVLTISCVRY